MTTQWRQVRWRDAYWCWRLRNEVAVRRGSISGAQRVGLCTHLRWYRQRLQSPYPFWIVSCAGKRLGLVRLDPTVPTSEALAVTIVVVPRWRERGYAVVLLHGLRQRWAGPLVALVRGDNPRSQRMFVRAGWSVSALRYDPQGCVVEKHYVPGRCRQRPP